MGPPDLRGLVRPEAEGRSIHSAADFDDWASALEAVELADPFTFVIDSAGVLRLAPRRSEHVACAGGGPVLGAGEMSFRKESGQWAVGEVSNQSTGYCPDISSWPAVARALDAAGIEHPSGFTHEVVFRRCPACGELNIVREEDFVCVFCEEALPPVWGLSNERVWPVVGGDAE
ncbi:hypothetical protein [Streptomyces sp. NBC_01363]|uniref:hypothetical protein n=1 Tax=Streptomyces sp. NBC_01363 TaxID=2903840 RepID=UPI0022569AFD|nr:hypothetical protein [Streptomyces sp. NBC_01363]MCX4734542.1 hypothetical protein [Streptomyces sp. NBC_01363]